MLTIQPLFMKAIDIVNNLALYQHMLNEVQQHEQAHIHEKEKSIVFTPSVSSAYNFITLTLTITKQDEEESLYCKITFVRENNIATFKELYCVDPLRTPLLEVLIKNSTIHQTNWKENHATPSAYNHVILNYLSIADSIAEKTMNCAAGDNYSPGAFSEIDLTSDRIILSQINHMNSRSLNHKEDYSLRDLQFIIPLNHTKITDKLFDSQRIGDMLVVFSDRSSKNNKRCGDTIQEAIDKEQLVWKDV